MAVTPDQINAITAVVTELPKLIHGIRELSKAVAAAVEDAYASLGSLREQEVRHNRKVRSAYEDLKTAADKALSYVNRVDKVFQYSRDEKLLRTIMEQLERTETRPGRRRRWLRWLRRPSYIVPAPQYQLLKEFIEHLKDSFAQVEQHYIEFQEAVREAITSTNNAAEECKLKAVQAQTQQEKTAWTGGAATAVAAGVLGAAAAALAGPFGFIAAAGAVSAVGGAATHHLYKGYEPLIKAFQKQHITLNELAQKGSEMQESAGQVREALTGLAMAVDDIERCQQNYETIESLCHHLRQMRVNFEAWSDAVSQCRSAIEGKKNELKRLTF